MISKEKKLIGFISSTIFILITVVVGISLAVFLGRRLPFHIADEYLEPDYLMSKLSYGEDLKIITGYVEENPQLLDENTATVYLDAEEEFTGDLTNISFIRVGNDSATFDQIAAAIEQDSCAGAGYITGVVGSEEYLLATCGIELTDGTTTEFSYYLYGQESTEELNWILFVTPNGEQQLSNLIEEYKTQTP